MRKLLAVTVLVAAGSLSLGAQEMKLKGEIVEVSCSRSSAS